MTLEQAHSLVAQVKKEFPDKIIASIRMARGGPGGGLYHTVVLTLVKERRVLTVYQPDQWESVKHAWSWFLGIEIPEEKPVYHLIGMIPMILYKQNGYWYGRYQKDRKTIRKYFGRQDPRPNYPIVTPATTH